MKKLFSNISTSTMENGDVVIELSKPAAKRTGLFSKNIYILYTLAHLKQKANVRGTALGYLWWFIEPALLIALYSYVVGVIFRNSGSERILMIAIGVTVWKWWSTSLGAGTKSFRKYKGVVTQVRMPLPILPVSEVFGQTYLFFFGYIILQCVLLIMGYPPDLLSLVLSLLASIIFISSMAIALAILNVFIRDTSFFVGFGLRILFWITPILYSIDRIPLKYRWMVSVNPFAHLIDFYYKALVYPQTVNLTKNVIVLFVSIGVLSFFIFICKRLTAQIVRNV